MHIIRSDHVVGNWTVPVLGIMRNKPLLSIPPEALYDGMNVIVRGGLLQARPGMTSLVPTVMTGRPTGAVSFGSLATGAFEPAAFENTAFQMASNVSALNLVVGTTRKIYAYYGGVLNDITGTTLTAGSSQLARFATIYLTATAKTWVLHCNGKDAPRQWDSTAATFTAVAGTPPAAFFDWTAISDHVVGVLAPYLIRWSNNQDIGTWPAANILSIGTTPDPISSIQAAGTVGGVILKTRSLWTIAPSGDATEAVFFRVDFRTTIDGPPGPAAAINVDGLIMWMSDNGRIGTYDGGGVTYVAEGIKPLIQATLDVSNANLIHAEYNRSKREVWFWFPRIGEMGTCKGLAIVKLPDPDNDAPTFAGFAGQSGLGFSAGADNVATRQVLLFTTDGLSKSVSDSGGDDDGTSITGFWQTGLVGTQGLEVATLDAFESFLQRGGTFGQVSVAPVSTYIFDSQGGTVGSAKVVNLALNPVVDPKSNSSVSGRAFGMYHSFASPVTIKWIGGQLAASTKKG